LGFKQKALEGEPRSALVFLHIGRSYWHQRRYDDTIEWVRKALEVDPHHVLPRELLAAAYLRKGDVVRFLDEVRRRSEIRDAPGGGMAHSPDAIAEMRDAYAEAGPQGLARCVLRHLPKGDYGPLLVRRVSLFGVAGDLDSAFELLDRCIERREPGLTDLAVSPQWDSLRDDPRFNERLARMGLVPAPVQRKP
jgi:tetratricopeptide (TPR) repeat protein